MVRSNPVQTDTEGAIEGVRIKGVSAPGGGGGTLDFKWQGWSKNFWGFEIFDFGIFWDRKVLASIFLGSLI